MAKVLKIDIELGGAETARAAMDRLDQKFKDVEKSADAMDKEVARMEATSRKHAAAVDAQASNVDLLTKRVLQFVSVTAVVSAIRNTAAWGSEIENMSKRLGATTTEVQTLSLAAKTNGTSIDAVTAAVWALNQRLANGDESAIAALGKLKLGLKDVKDDAPIETFIRLSHAVRETADPMRVSSDLFGRQAREIFPLLISNVDAAMRKFEEMGGVIDPLLVKKSADLDNKIDGLTVRFKTMVADGLEPAIPLLDHLADKDYSKALKDLAAIAISIGSFGTIDLSALEGVIDDITAKALNLPGQAPKRPGAPGGLMPKGVPEIRVDPDTTMNVINARRAILDEQARLAAELERDVEALDKAWHDFYFDMHMFGIEQIKELTKTVQAEMARQREAVQAAQMEILTLMNASTAARRVDALGGAASLDAQLEALAQAHQAKLQEIEQMGRRASAEGGTFWLEQTQTLAQEAEFAFQTAWNAIIASSGTTRDVVTDDIQAIGTKATETFTMIGVLVQRTSAELRGAAAQIENDLNDMLGKGQGTGYFGYYSFQQQKARELRERADRQDSHAPVPWGVPRFAEGVRNFGGGMAIVGERGPEMVRLPGGSDVIPNGRGMHGSVSVTIDARGANFSNEAAIELLADRVQQKLAPLFVRYGG
jgi:Skp family chaperone for outer membrane proteins